MNPARPSESRPGTYRTQTVGDVDIFYRQAGSVDVPVVLLLHGFPTSGHMFRDHHVGAGVDPLT